MSFRRKQSHEEKIIDYLVRDGFFSSLPSADKCFYQLAGVCSSSLWPTKPCSAVGMSSDPNKESSPNSCHHCQSTDATNICQGSDKYGKSMGIMETDRKAGMANSSDASVNLLRVDHFSDYCASKECSEAADSSWRSCTHCTRESFLFTPKPNLPFPIYQETYHKWHSGMDLGLRFRRLRKHRAALALQPLDDFPAFLTSFQFSSNDQRTLGFFEFLREFTRVFFFGADVRLMEPVSTKTWAVTSRVHSLTGQQQLLVGELNKALSAHCLSSDVFGVIGLTWTDLYPSPKQNFVLGQAACEINCASVSFGRFETNPREPDKHANYVDITKVDGELLWKLMKVIAHETCHIFYLAHCVFFDCLMNDSRSVAEAMSQPLYLCPVCTRKLQKVLKFPSVAEYHRQLLGFLQPIAVSELGSQSLLDTVTWLEKCLTFHSSCVAR